MIGMATMATVLTPPESSMDRDISDRSVSIKFLALVKVAFDLFATLLILAVLTLGADPTILAILILKVGGVAELDYFCSQELTFHPVKQVNVRPEHRTDSLHGNIDFILEDKQHKGTTL